MDFRFKTVISAMLAVSALLLSSTLWADDDDDKQSIFDAIAEGGQLYDKWWKVYDLKPPKGTHPAYPASGKQKGETTWRCKECHGWDYKGKDGAYAKGSHYTGIKGIRDYQEKSPEKIVAILKDQNHQYDKVMYDRALSRIALFVSRGQVEMNDYINNDNRKAKGEVKSGRAVFMDKCSRCHGEQGNDINFGNDVEPEFVGTVAVKNPWEAVHKILNGHPGAYMAHDIMHSKNTIHRRHRQGLIKPMEPMPSFRDELSDEGVLDLLTFLQILPVDDE
ncbi:MAG: cytochrome c [Gammaproteobacteria bacterium]|nr:cytochrome c [Gammaproteobacteria bacterium]MDH5614797.1 cytochrome c [Gammaproteobacteria bacterium]